ncbi:C-type lectin domain family 4 member C-like [Macrobrachium rosenbergii]|uniref:C-type lectin domain family 4 member C-like n=1 Tax=Macrobrachium rosenbergii TaxID=79674 RepID=UPI0034D3C718
MRKNFALLYFATVFLGVCTAFCYDPFMELGSSCYYFSDQEATWDSARATCKGMSTSSQTADLAVFDRTCGDQASIITHVTDLAPSKWWIGGSDDQHEGYWEWVDGTPINMIREYWSPDEPNGFEEENALILFRRLNETFPRWRVGDHISTDTHYYICQSED